MAKITDYQSLRDNIQEFLKRDDALSHLDTFIALAETDIWEVLRVREMEVRATASTSTSDRFLALPDGFIKMRRVQILVDSHYFDLDYEDPKNLNILYAAGTPTAYTITSQIEFNRTSDQAYTIETQYIKELDAITSSNTTNDVLTNYPTVYLAGALRHAFAWARHEQLAQYWSVNFDKEIARANRKSRHGRYGPAPAKKVTGWRP